MYKSSDGGDNWEEVYAETHDRTAVNCVVVDWYDPRKIYAGTNSGALLKSTDSGRSWVAMQWFDQNVKKIIVSYRDSRELYVQLDRAIHKSVNSAESFVDLQDFLEEFGKVTAIHDLVVHPQDKNIVYFISNLGLLKSSNGGQEWQDVPLLSYPGFSSVADLALDPQDSKVIYFSYDSNLYKSTDGGQNWSVKQFTSGTINSVVLNPSDTAVLYTGVLVSN